MAVDGFKVVRVTEDNVISVAFAFVFGEAHLAVECRADGIAGIGLEVDALVHAAETLAVAVGRGYVAGVGDGVVAHVDYGSLRNGGVLVAVYESAFPAFGVDVKFGLFFFGEEGFKILGGVVNLEVIVALRRDKVSVLFRVLAGKPVALGESSDGKHHREGE